MREAYVALGANLGAREQTLAEAIRRLGAIPGIEVRRTSPVYETEPVGYVDQPAFLNMTAAIATDLAPGELLRTLLNIEKDLGRIRNVRWGPRTIDLDLLLYQDVSICTEQLTLPHPRMGERAFVLVPLRDIWAEDKPFPWQRYLDEADPGKAGIRQWGRLDESVE